MWAVFADVSTGDIALYTTVVTTINGVIVAGLAYLGHRLKFFHLGKVQETKAVNEQEKLRLEQENELEEMRLRERAREQEEMRKERHRISAIQHKREDDLQVAVDRIQKEKDLLQDKYIVVYSEGLIAKTKAAHAELELKRKDDEIAALKQQLNGFANKDKGSVP